VAPVGAGVEEAEMVAVGIPKPGLPPQPRHVLRLLVEHQSRSAEPLDLGVEGVGLEVHSDLFGLGHGLHPVDREGGVAILALEPEVVVVLHDQAQSERPVEALGPVEVGGADRHLVEQHPTISLPTPGGRSR
jgi:hypothetical protein